MATTARSWTRGCVPCGPGTCHRRPSPSTRRQPASFGDHLAATGVGDVAEIRRAHVQSFLEHTLLTIPCQTASIYRWGASPPVLVGSDAIKREQIARLGGRLPIGSSPVCEGFARGAFDVHPAAGLSLRRASGAVPRKSIARSSQVSSPNTSAPL